MASEVKTNKLSPSTGVTLSIGDAGDTLALATDAVTGLNVGSDARGDILYHDGTDYTRLAKPGTPADELLTFATGASDPAWVAPAAGGLSQYSIWVMDTTFTGSADPMTNWTEASVGYERIGTVIGESSGVFTLPETGKWEVHLFANGSGAGWPTNTGNSYHIAYSTNSGVSFSDLSRAERWGYGGTTEQTSCASMVLFDVTNTSTHLIRFRAYARTASNITGGSATGLSTYAVFKKIGAT